MGDKFNSGGGDEQVAKDQATNVHQDVDGNNNIISGNGGITYNNITINHNYLDTKVLSSKKDFASSLEEKDILSISISYVSYFKNKLKVTWQVIDKCSGSESPPSYDVNAKQIRKFSIKVTEALNNYIGKINSSLSIFRINTLAQEGYRLFACLFPENYKINDKIKQENSCMKIIIKSDIDIPWNCIYINDDFKNVKRCDFLGNRYEISVDTHCNYKEIFCKNSRYAARDLDRLKEIKFIISNKFERTIHLVDKKQNNYINNRMEVLECKSLKDFCKKIKGHDEDFSFSPNLLFICFDKCNVNFFNRNYIVHIGDLQLPINELKRELSEFKEEIDGSGSNSPFVIIIGNKANYSDYIQLKNLFIKDMKWNGIVIDGNVGLNLADKYLFDFFAKFTDGNNSVPEVLFKLRKEHEIGLAFTAYCNDNVCFKQYS